MEYIYIVKNEAFPQMVKIGRTKNIQQRLMELNQIIPTQWELVKSYEVENSAYTEKFIHNALSNTRVREDREFFSTLGMDIVVSVDVLVADADHFYAKRRFKSVEKIDSFTQICKLIREARIAKKLTQEELAIRSDISRATIARVEAGQRETSIVAILKLLKVLDCELRVGMFVDKDKQRRRIRKMYNIHAP